MAKGVEVVEEVWIHDLDGHGLQEQQEQRLWRWPWEEALGQFVGVAAEEPEKELSTPFSVVEGS